MSAPPELTVVLLAAGLSQRFGAADKLEQLFQGKPLAVHAGAMLAGPPFAQRLAVCRGSTGLVPDGLRALGFDIVVNPAPERGMASSIAVGTAAAAPDAAGLLICLADMPKVSAALVEQLVHRWAADPTRIVAAAAGDYRGPPVVFPRTQFAALLALSGDRGARGLLDEAVLVAADAAELRDFDVPGDFE